MCFPFFFQGGVNTGLRAAVWVSKEFTQAPKDAAVQPTHVIRNVGGLAAVIDALLVEDGAS
jgi:hypothetical protein